MTDIRNNTAPIDPDDPLYAKLLQNLQGNILKGHGRENVVLILFRFTRPPEEVRAGLKEIVPWVTSAKEQARQAKQFRDFQVPGGLFANFFLSATGYRGLGYSEEQFAVICPHEMACSFVKGMKDVAVADLGDPPVKEWEKPYRNRIDAMLLLADNDKAFLLRRAREAIAKIETFAEIVTVEHGAALRNEKGEGIEHFGFADGRSQPIFFKEDMNTGEPSTKTWDPAAPLMLALAPDRAVADEDAYGSFLVYRKLEQDVRHFMIREQELADQLKLKGHDRERAGAMIIGRFRDGTPLAVSAVDGHLPGKENDFTYADDPAGAKCPLHAHIRKANPRGEVPHEIMDPESQTHVRIVRRGIPYGVRKRHPSEFQSLDDLPSDGVGLLFMCFQRMIETQFRFIHQNWVNFGGFREPGTGIDPLIGQGTVTAQRWPNEYGSAEPHCEAAFGGFVKMKGGEYFFTPSIPFLRKLGP